MQTGGFPRPSTSVRLVVPPLRIRSLAVELGDIGTRRHRRASTLSWGCLRPAQYYWQPGSTFLDRRVLPRILPLFEVFPKLPVPRVVKLGFILPWTRSPSELYSSPLSTVRSVSNRIRPSLAFRRLSTASSIWPLTEASCPPSPRCRSQVFSTSQRFQL